MDGSGVMPVSDRICRPSTGAWLFLLFALTFLFSGTKSGFCADPKGNMCIQCHLDTWEEFKGSIHAQNGIFCESCHGGDPAQADQTKAKSPESGYIGAPDKKLSVETCGKCHSDVEFMNPYGISTDQLARYKTSRHGQKLFQENDTKVAGCLDCHGYHDVKAVSDPNSSVYPLNIPKTCNKCHGNKRLMENYGLPADMFETYKESVHGQALLERKNLSAAHCASCHGSHGAVPPGVSEIGSTCGKCHANEKKYFSESNHASLLQDGKFSECISCHGNHGVQKATPALYNESCIKCHAAGSNAYHHGQMIRKVFSESTQMFEDAKSELKAAAARGFFVEEETAELENAKTSLIELGPTQHTLSKEKVLELESKIGEVTKDVQTKIARKKKAVQQRKILLVLIWIFIIVMVTALWKKYHRLKSNS